MTRETDGNDCWFPCSDAWSRCCSKIRFEGAILKSLGPCLEFDKNFCNAGSTIFVQKPYEIRQFEKFRAQFVASTNQMQDLFIYLKELQDS